MCIMPCQGKHGCELCQANSALKHKLAFQVYIWCKIYSKKYDFKSGLFFTPLSVFFTHDFIIRKRIAFTFLRLLKGNNICIRYPFSPRFCLISGCIHSTCFTPVTKLYQLPSSTCSKHINCIAYILKVVYFDQINTRYRNCSSCDYVW